MPSPSSDLVRDAASLLRFIRSVYRRREETDRTHRQATTRFLDYITALGQKTERYLKRSSRQLLIQILSP
jgi:hypothetical protein